MSAPRTTEAPHPGKAHRATSIESGATTFDALFADSRSGLSARRTNGSGNPQHARITMTRGRDLLRGRTDMTTTESSIASVSGAVPIVLGPSAIDGLGWKPLTELGNVRVKVLHRS